MTPWPLWRRRPQSDKPSEARSPGASPAAEPFPPSADGSNEEATLGSRAVWLEGGNRGIISTGDNTVNWQTMLPAEALRPVEEVAAPRNLVNLPVQAELFVGREKDLSDLERALDGQSRVVVAAVHGL